MSTFKNLDKVVALAGGCVLFAGGSGTPALALGTAASGAAILGEWLAGRSKHGPESKRVIAAVTAKVRAEFDVGNPLSAVDAALLDGADFSLGAIILECIPSQEKLAEAFGHPEGFVKTTAALVLAEVSARDDLFAETGERAEPLARHFATVAIEAALECALTDKDYFSGLMPFVLQKIARDAGKTLEVGVATRDGLGRMGAEVSGLKTEVSELIDLLTRSGHLDRARRAGITEAAWIELARRIADQVEDPEQAFRELERSVDELVQLRREALVGTNLGALVDQSMRRIADKAAQGRFEESSAEVDKGLERLDREQAEIQESLKQNRIKLVEEGIRQDGLRRNVAAVCDRIVVLRELTSGVPVADSAQLRPDFHEWLKRGIESYINFDLEVAAALAGQALKIAATPEQRGFWLTYSGIALYRLGERHADTVLLELALSRFRAALREIPRNEKPLQWAQTKHYCGEALWRIGERNYDARRIRSAMTALRAALKERTRERVPALWADSLSRLATAYNALGEMTQEPVWLEKAIVTYEEALTAISEPDDVIWANTQNDLGTALHTLGEIRGDVALLARSIRAYDAALEQWPSALDPLPWAATSLSRALAMGQIADHSGDRRSLESALASARTAADLIDGSEHVSFAQWARYVFNELERIEHRLGSASSTP